MAEIIKMPNSETMPSEGVNKGALIEIADDARTEKDEQKSLSIPVAELSTLGVGVSSLIPALRTVT